MFCSHLIMKTYIIHNLSLTKKIIKLVDYEVKENSINLVMEYCEMNLHQYLTESVYPLSRQNIKTITYMILKGLKELHSRDFIHRVISKSLFKF